MVRLSKKLKASKTYLFAEIAKKKNKLIADGHKVLDFGVGDSYDGAPKKVVTALIEAAKDSNRHHYSYYNGIPEFREAVSDWFKKRFDQYIDSKDEVTVLIGSKEAVFRFPQVVIDQGDYALIPEPGYPPNAAGVEHAGGKIYYMPLLEKNKFLPDLDLIPTEIKKAAKVIYLNYPSNPTSAVATEEFYKKVLAEATKYDWTIFSDMAYCEIYDGKRPLSMLQFDTKKERTLEFYSFSKSYNMTGWRLGFAVGNKELINGLIEVKSTQGSAPFEPVQLAGIAALQLPDSRLDIIRDFYSNNRKWMGKILQAAGISFHKTNASFYMWANVPKGYTSAEFTTILLEKHHIVATPGSGLGTSGEGFFRLALTRGKDDMEEFEKRFSKIEF